MYVGGNEEEFFHLEMEGVDRSTSYLCWLLRTSGPKAEPSKYDHSLLITRPAQ